MDIFLILSALYLFSIVSLTAIVFLWLLGASKARREARRLSHSPHQSALQLECNTLHHHPLPQSHLIPRRLSFSAATPASVQQPRSTTPRRVTFNLTPEQQRAELAKSHTPPQPPPSQPPVPSRRVIKAPLLELFDSSTSQPTTKTPPLVVRHTPFRAKSPTNPALQSHRAKSADGPDLTNLLSLVKGEGKEIREKSRAIDDKLKQMEGQNGETEENRPFGFAPAAVTYSFGLMAQQRIGLRAFGGEVGRTGKRRAVH